MERKRPQADLLAAAVLGLLLFPGVLFRAEEPEKIDSASCVNCHEESAQKTPIPEDLAKSIHKDLACQDCHQDKTTFPHGKAQPPFRAGCQGCRSCHTEQDQQYRGHGREAVGKCEDIPSCASCHGTHGILPSSNRDSRTHPSNLPATCGACHENVNLVKKYQIPIEKPVELYEASVHGKAAKGGVYVAATCIDCHSVNGSAHEILAPGDPRSSINHFNIHATCGKCHKGVEQDYLEGIHGKMAMRGETDVPVCTTCHGEHGILPPSDPRSPVSPVRMAEATCAPCHESATLNEKYGLPTGRLVTFIDSYHGLKTKAGDVRVANCASCHGVHRILPSSDPTSTVNPNNLQKTCGECHPGISKALSETPIHGIRGGLRTRAADIVAKIYLAAIVLIIGLMVLHWLLDLGRQILNLLRKHPQVVRMRLEEVWQHAALLVTFLVLVVSGFSLRFSESWVARFFFGWEGGFRLRGTVHRVAAVLFLLTVAWHLIFLAASRRGRVFFKDMLPKKRDFEFFWKRILYNLGKQEKPPCIQRFSYVEKAEYWALVWGTAVMALTGILLWFDNWFIHYLPKGALDVALVVHYYEAWLATLAIAVWHLYSTVFNPEVYPMNPSWLTGRMPESMYEHEHPGHLEEARKETAEYLRREMEILGRQDSKKEEKGP